MLVTLTKSCSCSLSIACETARTEERSELAPNTSVLSALEVVNFGQPWIGIAQKPRSNSLRFERRDAYWASVVLRVRQITS